MLPAEEPPDLERCPRCREPFRGTEFPLRCPSCGCAYARIFEELDVLDEMKTNGTLSAKEWWQQRQRMLR